MSTSKTIKRLKKGREHRAAYVSSKINIGLPFQIRALRNQRGWDQKTLALEAGMAQPRISALENPGYGRFTLETLKRLANAFDIDLVVTFAPFSEGTQLFDSFSPDEFAVPSFEEELQVNISQEDAEYACTSVVRASAVYIPANQKNSMEERPYVGQSFSETEFVVIH